MVKIHINGKTFEVKADRNLLQTCISLGFDIPYFCYHPALGSVGACRLCAVKKYANADDRNGKIVMSCMEPVTDGLIISVDHPDVLEFRSAVIEGLMTNHPHDCPVCDEGGECHLQDMTVMTGHNYSKYVFRKRTHKNQFLGPFIQHEMNRCIQCYRCVRFYKDYAGGRDLNVFGAANRVYFGRHKEGILESEFSGNLVEVCPTGVFTDKTLKRHYARKWDMTHSPSVCVHCSLGCNTILSERYGTVRRTMSRYNSEINGYFLCDRGRFGYEFINDDRRVKKIYIRRSKSAEPEVVDDFPDSLTVNSHGKGKIIGLGSPRASLEANYALLTLVGKENFYHGISAIEHDLVRKALDLMGSGTAFIPSLKQIEKHDAIVVLGEDITNTAPMMALAIRQAIRNKALAEAEKQGIPNWNDAAVRVLNPGLKNPLFIASPFSTKLDEVAVETFYGSPQDIARLGFSIGSAIHGDAPVVSDQGEKLSEMAGKIADALLEAENPLIITGISLRDADILHGAENLLISLSARGKKPGLAIALPECNSAGLGMMDGKPMDEAIGLIGKDGADTLIILENDLYKRIPGEKAGLIFDRCRQVIVMDHLMHETANRADILLPVGTYAESSGTLINNEGRAQRYYPVLQVKGPVKESWEWNAELSRITGASALHWEKFDDVVSSLTGRYTVFSQIREHLPKADLRFFNEKISRQTMRYSGRTAISADVSVSEPAPPDDPDSPLEYSMEGYQGVPPSSVTPFYWSPGWNSSQAVNKYMEEPDGRLKNEDPGIFIRMPVRKEAPAYRQSVPIPFMTRDKELFIIPVHRIFGSEELSSYGQAIASLAADPFVLLNKKEADRLSCSENENYDIVVDHARLHIKIIIDNKMPDGIAGLSGSKPGMPHPDVPGWGEILRTGFD